MITNKDVEVPAERISALSQIRWLGEYSNYYSENAIVVFEINSSTLDLLQNRRANQEGSFPESNETEVQLEQCNGLKAQAIPVRVLRILHEPQEQFEIPHSNAY